MAIKLKEGEWYWLDAAAIDLESSLTIGQYGRSGTVGKWYICGQLYAEGTGIDVIAHIRKPKNA